MNPNRDWEESSLQFGFLLGRIMFGHFVVKMQTYKHRDVA